MQFSFLVLLLPSCRRRFQGMSFHKEFHILDHDLDIQVLQHHLAGLQEAADIKVFVQECISYQTEEQRAIDQFHLSSPKRLLLDYCKKGNYIAVKLMCGRWRRALFVRKVVDSYVKVFYLDYGFWMKMYQLCQKP